MAAFSQLLSHIYAITIVFFSLLVLEVVVLIQSVTGSVENSDNPIVSTTQYLKLIEERNPTFPYSGKLRQISMECAVCLSEFLEGESLRKLKCGHTFHKDCLDKWLQQYLATCPLCRSKVLPDEIVAKYHRLQNQMDYDGSDEDMIFLLSALHDELCHGLQNLQCPN